MVAPKPSPHVTPTEPDYLSSRGLKQGSANLSGYPDFATLALPASWKDAYEWAAELGLAHELLHIVNATLLWNYPNALGTLLAFISSEETRSLLEEWAFGDKSAKLLHSLSEAVIQHPLVISQYPPLPSERSAGRQFHKYLKSHYLIALLTQGLPPGQPSDRGWFVTIKLWLLTHAVDRAYSGNIQDFSIRQVASKLRMASDQVGDWRKLFFLLKSEQTEFGAFSRNIIQKSTGLLASKSIQIPPTQRPLLHALIKVARREHSQDTQNGQASWPIILIPDLYGRQDDHSFHPATQQIAEDVDGSSGNPQWISSSDESTESFIQYGVNGEQSFAHQRMQGNSVILYSTEELQYLPWTWNKLNVLERQKIERWLEDTRKSNPELRFFSCVIWMALNLGRSLQRTLDIHICSHAEKDWCINPDTLTLARLPPRREPGWHPRTVDQEQWITPSAATQSITLPVEVGTILLERSKACVGSDCLGDLWDTRRADSPSHLFRHEFVKIAPRVTEGMLANALPQYLFEISGDQTFARFMASHPQTALPGACAYSSWSSHQVAQAMPGNLVFVNVSESTHNAMGSLLDPIESLLVNSIRSAAEKLEVLRNGNDLVAFHNAYTAYLVVALLAATGARPIRDPFESCRHFDLSECFVYISDKSSNEIRQARLVPLPSELCKIIEDDYLHHLSLLAKYLISSNPPLAEAISNLLSRTAKTTVPFLFFLAKNALAWKSVGESEIMALGLFDWPLPLNHFRHRLSRQLRKHNVDPEVIDSILGHAETGAATHGDYSFRVWADDMPLARPALEACFGSLGFSRIKEWNGKSTGISTSRPVTDPCNHEFGASAREKKRRRKFIAAIRDADFQIEEFLNQRALSELTEAEIDQLSRQLLFRQDGMPYPNGYVKYRFFLKRIEREWKRHGRKIKLSKRYHPITDERTPFTVFAPGTLALFKEIKGHVSAIPDTYINKISLRDAAVISAALLCLENRISSKELLADIMHARNFRLVSLKNTPYLEYAKDLKAKHADVPIKRYRLPERTALFLDRLLESSYSANLIPTIPNQLLPISRILERAGRLHFNADANSLVNSLADIVDQVNAITLPGILAGYLAGRIQSYSLMWRDWARLELEHHIQVVSESGDEEIDNSTEAIGSPISAIAATTSPHGISSSALQQSAHEFLKNVGQLLADYQSSPRAARSKASRRDMARDIQGVIEGYDGKVSTFILLLGRWINSLLFRKGKGDLIQISSIERYLAALSDPLAEVGHSADILSMDDDDITHLYSELLEASTVKDKKYVVDRLTDFHRWAKREFAIEDPDWAELPEAASTIHVSPGLITEAEYQKALQLLLNVPESDTRRRLAAPLLLMLCYRFGLRSGEALGLLRSDLAISDSLMIVYVQNNRFRTLKTSTSRRQVPLMFNLSDIEHNLLGLWMGENESMHGNDLTAPLFSDPGTANKRIAPEPIKKKALAALKISTGNPDINIHHARHSAANFVAVAIARADLAIWNNASPLCQEHDSIRAESLLMGRPGQTRRKMWATSRFLGHIRRDTTCRNYLHFLGDMVDRYACRARSNNVRLKNAITLEDFPRLAPISTCLLEQLEPIPAIATPSRVLKLMRLLARGRPIHEAARSLSLENHVADSLLQLLTIVGGRIKLSKSKLSDKGGNVPPYDLLVRRLKEPAWDRLINFTTKMDQEKSVLPTETLGINEIVEMIGATRQVLLWEEKHFVLLGFFLKHMMIGETGYTLVTSNQATELLNKPRRQNLWVVCL